MAQLDKLFELMIRENASDLHLVSGSPPVLRVHGELRGGEDTDGAMRASHFFAHAGAHPLCYSVAYYLNDHGAYRSLTEFFTEVELRQMLGDGYLLQPQDSTRELFCRAIDRLWAEGDPTNVLPAVRRLVQRMYPSGKRLASAERQAVAEESVFAVCLHSHMDEDTLDLARLVACPDQVPDAEGRLIPACAYNLFYREKDPRFWGA